MSSAGPPGGQKGKGSSGGDKRQRGQQKQVDNKRPDKKQKKKSSSSSSNGGGGGGGGGGGDSRPFKLPAGETKDVAKMYERNAVSDADREAAEKFFDNYVWHKNKMMIRQTMLEVTLPDDLEARAALSFLSYYHDQFPTGKEDKTSVLNPKDLAPDKWFQRPVISVSMKLGGEDVRFAIVDSDAVRQILIDFDGLSGSYNGLVKAIEKDKDSVGATEAEVADAMLKMVDRGVKCKDSKIKDPKTKKSKDIWPKGISPGQRQAAMAILVITHVAETAVPDKDQELKVSASEHRGRFPLAAPWVRAFLKEIRAGSPMKNGEPYTFRAVFDSSTGLFVQGRKGGVAAMRALIQGYDMKKRFKTDLALAAHLFERGILKEFDPLLSDKLKPQPGPPAGSMSPLSLDDNNNNMSDVEE